MADGGWQMAEPDRLRTEARRPLRAVARDALPPGFGLPPVERFEDATKVGRSSGRSEPSRSAPRGAGGLVGGGEGVEDAGAAGVDRFQVEPGLDGIGETPAS